VKYPGGQEFDAGEHHAPHGKSGSRQHQTVTEQAGNGLSQFGEPLVVIPLPSAGAVLRAVAGQQAIIPRRGLPLGDAPMP
jgi:hypothetical protein